MDQLLTLTLFFDHFSFANMHFLEHTIFHFLEDCDTVHPEDICFLLMYVMDMTLKVPSWMKVSHVIGLLIMKGTLIRQAIHHDI